MLLPGTGGYKLRACQPSGRLVHSLTTSEYPLSLALSFARAMVQGIAPLHRSLSLSLSLSSSPGHEGLSKPLGLVGPPDVCGGIGWGVKAACLSDSSPLCGFITWGFGSGHEVVSCKQRVIKMHTIRLPPDPHTNNRFRPCFPCKVMRAVGREHTK